MAIGTVFLAIQLVRIYTPPADPVDLDPPLAGEWADARGRAQPRSSPLLPDPIVGNAVDFVRLDERAAATTAIRSRKSLGTASASPC